MILASERELDRRCDVDTVIATPPITDHPDLHSTGTLWTLGVAGPTAPTHGLRSRVVTPTPREWLQCPRSTAASGRPTIPISQAVRTFVAEGGWIRRMFEAGIALKAQYGE